MIRRLILFALLVCFPLAPSIASEFATKEDAIAMTEKVEALLKSMGKEKVVADLNADPKRFVDRDLYITLVDEGGIRVFHGQNAKLVGKSLAESVDVNGKAFGKEMMEVANKSGTGWVDYMFKDPVTQKILPKTSYIKKVNDIILVCGVYKR